MDNKNCLSKTPTKMMQTDDFPLPDTPTSLTSSYNADVSYNQDTQKNMVESTNKIKYNPLDDSIESFVSYRVSPTQHNKNNKSIFVDFADIDGMIEKKMSENQHENDTHLIQKWLEDRKRWDVIQRKYEQKLLKQELKYQNEIKNLTQHIESKQNKQIIKMDADYHELSENNRILNTKYQDLQESFDEKQNEIRSLKEKLDEKGEIINILQTENKNPGIRNEEISEYKLENERLKHLELTSQNMVERLLKRLEQQIHSSEKIQKQLNLKEEEHEKEIMKLEQINAKLQKHLTVFNAPQPPFSRSRCSSQSSLFTLNTVMTMDKPKDLNLDSKQRQSVHIDTEKDNEFAKQSELNERLIADINRFEIMVNDEKDMINNLQITIGQQRNSISILEKSNSDISSELIEQRALRQEFEKQVEDLQFDNKQLRNKLISFKKHMEETVDGRFEHCPRPASANNAIHKDQLLLDSLRRLIEKHSNINIDNVEANEPTKKNKKQCRFTAPQNRLENTLKNTLVNKGNFIHKTANNYNKNKKQPRPRHRICSMAPVSYLHDEDTNNTARKISMRRKRNINKIRNQRKSNKCKVVTVSQTCRNPTKCKSQASISKSKRKKKVSSQSVSKRHALKPCIHKRLL